MNRIVMSFIILVSSATVMAAEKANVVECHQFLANQTIGWSLQGYCEDKAYENTRSTFVVLQYSKGLQSQTAICYSTNIGAGTVQNSQFLIFGSINELLDGEQPTSLAYIPEHLAESVKNSRGNCSDI